MSWFVAYRMDWIAETIRVFGFINREHLVRKFGLSTPQASRPVCEAIRRREEGRIADDLHLRDS